MYLIARYFYLFNYDEKYSNEVVNLSRGMLITCVCSVSTILKNIPAQTELPQRGNSVLHLEPFFGGPWAPGRRFLKVQSPSHLLASGFISSLQARSQGSGMHLPQNVHNRVKLHWTTPFPPHSPTHPNTHTHARMPIKLCQFGVLKVQDVSSI